MSDTMEEKCEGNTGNNRPGVQHDKDPEYSSTQDKIENAENDEFEDRGRWIHPLTSRNMERSAIK